MPKKFALCTSRFLLDLKTLAGNGKVDEVLHAWAEEKLGESVSLKSLRRWCSSTYRVIPPKSATQPQQEIEDAVAVKVSVDRQIEGMRAERDYFKRLYKQSVKDSAGTDKVIAVAKEVTLAIPQVSVRYRAPLTQARSPQSAVAPLCDTHIGEEVDPEQMGGLNSYNMEIFNRRLFGWSEQVANLTGLRKKYVDIPRLYVPMLGDMCSGEIHLELLKTNLDHAMGQMIRGAHMIAQALVSIAPSFAEVRVPCVVGNHGRMTMKPPAKDKYVDWDYLLYQWTAAFCRDQKNIKFEIPKSFLHVFEVEGKNILMMHGDSVKSWQGIPFYGLFRAVAQLRQTLQLRRGLEEDLQTVVKNKGTEKDALLVLAEYFDSVLVGHFHTNNEIDIGTGALFVCSCMKGGDEFSFGKLHTLARPSQILIYYHPKYGYISKDMIYLERYDRSEKMFVDALPSVWIDTETGR